MLTVTPDSLTVFLSPYNLDEMAPVRSLFSFIRYTENAFNYVKKLYDYICKKGVQKNHG